MISKKLTIAIPTYNRPGPLVETLRQLYSQKGIDRCEVIVVDNASEISMCDVIAKESPELSNQITIHRNRANLGVSGNIVRCIEMATCEWVWILADDDDIAPGALSHLLAAADKSKDLDFVLFGQQEGQRGGIEVASAAQFIEAVDHWARLGFLSSTMYRVTSVQGFLNVGITYAYTLFPFVAMMIQGLETRKWKASLDSFVPVILAHKGASFWPLMFAINAYVTAELVEEPKAAKRLLKLASKWCLGPVGLTHDFLTRKASGESGLSRLSFEHKLYLIGRVSLVHETLAKVCLLASHLPPAAILAIINRMRNLMGKDTKHRAVDQDVFGRI